MTALLVFDTTHHAMWAEQLAQVRGLAVDIVPAPAEATARCNLALEVGVADRAELERVLTAAGVPYRVHREA